MKKQYRLIVFVIFFFASLVFGSENNKAYTTESFTNSIQTNQFESSTIVKTSSEVLQDDEVIVYRCGKSKIYHPTTRHSSFKRCTSGITKLTVKKAKSLGMRHCKCRS